MIQLLDIKVDVVFKDFFGDKNNKEILESFINSVLGFQGDDLIEIEEFLDPRKMRVEIGKPSTFVDLSVKSKGGERYIIEMQTYNHEGFDKRLLYYLGKDYTEQLDYSKIDIQEPRKGKKTINYHDLPKVHVIAVVDFHRCHRTQDGILNGNQVMETYCFKPEFSSSNDHLFDQWKATILDLKKFEDKPLEELKTDRDKWFYLLKNASVIREKEVHSLKKQPIFRRALERLERISSDPATRKEYEASINDHRDHMAVMSASWNEGRKEGKEEGLKEGKEQALKQLENIARALKAEMPIDQISKLTGLLPDVIKNL